MYSFVDVSNMSDQEIKRLGQMDDIDHQPQQTRLGRPTTVSVKHTITDVWAAAVAAQRTNGEYLKEDRYSYNEETNKQTLVKKRNRDVMMEFLATPDRLTVDMIEAGEQCLNFVRNDLTFRTIKGKTTDFDKSVKKVIDVVDWFDSQLNKYELAIVACLPASAERSQARQSSDQRVQFAKGGFIGAVGDKGVFNVEVLSANFSQKFNIYWIKAITEQDQPVFFSNKEKFGAGTHLTIKGTVKAHRDNLTQLTRVQVL